MGSQLDDLLNDANASEVESTDDDWGDISAAHGHMFD